MGVGSHFVRYVVPTLDDGAIASLVMLCAHTDMSEDTRSEWASPRPAWGQRHVAPSP